ncbi:methyltransferase domain-containing protein [Sphingomonas profundi]|uniref:methyltransferase domain-containing protein n=1 Tax=Alterirhizorhabdus profundi TaxID=2681549 RepID=UPI0012E76E06|nr:methyltransferase domain-containing protein [Sphingomonas profundi]
MDAADLPADAYAAVLADLARVNVVTMSARPTLAFLARAVGAARRLRLLDVGFGQGDMLRAIARWAGRRGIAAELVGIDLNPNSAPAARAATPADMAIDYRTGDYADLAGQRWDCIVSSFVTHHMDEAQIDAFLRFMEAESAMGWMVNDLHRHRFAWYGFPLLAAALRWHPIVRADGRLSVARAFRPDEWRAMLADAGIAEARVVRRFPFRLCVERFR